MIEQIIRPTGLGDPSIEIMPSKNQVDHLFGEINKTIKSNFGDWSYEIIDTKNTSKVKKDHIYQINHNFLLLKLCLFSFLKPFCNHVYPS